MRIIKFSPSQKKITIIGLAILLAFLVFWLFIYLPSKNTVKRIKSELISADNEIGEIEAAISEAKTADEGIRLLKQRYQELNNKFPPGEEDSLRMLSDFAKKLNIEITSIKPGGSKRPFLDEDNKNVEIEGKTCQIVSVSIEMSCLYKDLVEYLQTLKESLPAFMSIEKLKISKDKLLTKKLNITLDLNLYLLF